MEDKIFIGWNKLWAQGLVKYDFSNENQEDENNNIIVNSSSKSEEGNYDKDIDDD